MATTKAKGKDLVDNSTEEMEGGVGVIEMKKEGGKTEKEASVEETEMADTEVTERREVSEVAGRAEDTGETGKMAAIREEMGSIEAEVEVAFGEATRGLTIDKMGGSIRTASQLKKPKSRK
jgi:hypothetical protein